MNQLNLFIAFVFIFKIFCFRYFLRYLIIIYNIIFLDYTNKNLIYIILALCILIIIIKKINV